MCNILNIVKSKNKCIAIAHVSKISFLRMHRWVFLKNLEQKFQKKTLITLIFKLEALVIGNEFDFDGDI